MNEPTTIVTTITLDPLSFRRLEILKRLDERADGNRSEMGRILINEEWERRGLPAETSLENGRLVFVNGA